MIHRFVFVLLASMSTIIAAQLAFANKAHDMLQKLSEKDRDAALAVLLKTSGKTCDAVTKSFFQGIDKSTGAAFWNVACRDKSAYAIMINNDATGSTNILSCAMLKAVNAGECFKKF